MAGIIQNSNTVADLIDDYRAIIEGTITELTIPKGINKIGESVFQYQNSITSVVVSNGVEEIKDYAFNGCTNLSSIVYPISIKNVGFGTIINTAYYNNQSNWTSAQTTGTKMLFVKCGSLSSANRCLIKANDFSSSLGTKTAYIPAYTMAIAKLAFNYNTRMNVLSISSNMLKGIGDEAFSGCSSLTTINLPASLEFIGDNVFMGCNRLETVSLGNGFNCDNLDLSASTQYSVDTIVSWLNALADRTGETIYTLTIGSTNLNKLTAEQIAIATNKNWNLA